MRERVYIIDDDAVSTSYINGVAASANYETAVFETAAAFLNHATPDHRGCIILDLHMEEMNGLELQAELLRRSVLMPVIIVSGRAQVASAVQAMKQRAFDLFEKPVDPQALINALQRAISHDAQQTCIRAEKRVVLDNFSSLSPRERQVMGLVVQGLANKQVASHLDLSEKTIEVHRGNVMRKMKVDSLAALVRAALHCDLSVALLISQPPSQPD